MGVDAWCTKARRWFRATIVKTGTTRARVHWDKWEDRYDCDLPISTLRRLGTFTTLPGPHGSVAPAPPLELHQLSPPPEDQHMPTLADATAAAVVAIIEGAGGWHQ